MQHWVANNLLGLAFAVNGIELLNLNSVQTGVLLLCGLFVYDIFWVFGTNVMVTVARSFEAPIKRKWTLNALLLDGVTFDGAPDAVDMMLSTLYLMLLYIQGYVTVATCYSLIWQ